MSPRPPVISDSLQKGLALFDAGQFHQAHEAWEPGWLAAQGRQRAVLQTLILWAGALHHAQNGNTVGAWRLLTRATERLGHSSALGFEAEALHNALTDSWLQLKAGVPVKPAPLRTMHCEEHEPQLELDHLARCPYCGEAVLVSLDPEATGGASYVEDCPVCCRPWSVVVSAADGVTLELKRADD